jgi:hypothetical protein
VKLSIDELKQILECAEEKDLDDELSFDYESRWMCITIYLNNHAWKKFMEIVKIKDIVR